MTPHRTIMGTVSAAALALALASPAFAQDQAIPPSVQDAQSANQPDQADELQAASEDDAIIVTGSRIARPELDQPNPITSYDRDVIEQSGLTNITDFLVQNPALIGSSTSSDQSGSTSDFGGTGINLLNLRNLGSNRTLVLVDGRRHVSGLPGSASVDINTIPQELIEGIDILTGGVSAVYGADGVSGVVNFRLRRNFEGVALRGQAGVSEYGDAGSQYVSATVGRNFADGRGNATINYEFRNDERLNSFNRRLGGDPLRTFGLVQNPDDLPVVGPNGPTDNAALPDRILLNNLRYADSSRDGAVDLNLDGIPDFTGSGRVYDRGRLLPRSGGLTQGGDSTPLAGYQGDLQPKNKIHNVNLLTSFEFSEAFRVFAQGKYTRTEAFSVAQPSFDFFTYLAPDNPFLIQRFGAAATQDGALVSRDNFDFGIRGEASTRETLRGVIGVDGKITDHARYELSYTYGQTKSRFDSTNYRIADRYFAAIDAVRAPNGQIVCRSSLNPGANINPDNFDAPATTFTPGAGSGCVPLNILGENVRDPAALAFINADLQNRFKVTQNVVTGSLSGDFGQFFELPGGPIAFALGGEYRKETSDFVSDPLLQAGELADIAQIAPASGEFDVKEAFAELNVPILKDLPFAETLAVGAAVRLSDYSTVGTTTTWSVNGVYAPIRDIRIRGTYSQAVRAPNIDELFAPQNGTFAFIDDPCDPVNIPEGSEFRQANCNALLTGLGINPATFSPTSDPTATVSLPGRSGGNPNLTEEEARTWTVGAVFRPSFLPGFSATVDWYDIKLRDAVATATAQDLVDLCVDQPTLDNPFCANVSRSPTTGYVSDYLVGPANVAAFETAGLDFQLNYQRALSPALGTVNLKLVGNYLDKLSFVPTPGADVDDDRNETGAPKWSGTFDLTWVKGAVSVNYGINYFSETRRFTTEQTDANPDIADSSLLLFKERWLHDIQIGIAVDRRFRLYGGVNNVFGQRPDLGSSTYPSGYLGRYFYMGARVGLDDLF